MHVCLYLVLEHVCAYMCRRAVVWACIFLKISTAFSFIQLFDWSEWIGVHGCHELVVCSWCDWCAWLQLARGIRLRAACKAISDMASGVRLCAHHARLRLFCKHHARQLLGW